MPTSSHHALRTLGVLLCYAPCTLGNFVSGAICDATNVSTLSQDVLRGKHLVIGELWWGPYATPDDTAPKGWSGINVETYDRLANLMGFTYEIKDVGYPLEGETWTGMMPRVTQDVDLLGSFWVHNPERADQIVFVRGIYDLSPVLVARMLTAAENKAANWMKSFTSFLDPFSNGLWAAVIGVIVLSAVVDYVIEVKKVKETTITASLYEYFAGFLWGGFEYPLSKSSAVYQLILGFFVLVLVSAYTANLAAFITVSAQPVASVESMDQSVLDKSMLCATAGGYMPRVQAIFPRVQWGMISQDQYEPIDATATGDGCDGWVTLKLDYMNAKTQAEYCSLELVETISPGLGGWATSKEAHCISEAISWGLMKLDEDGGLELLVNSYFNEAGCATETTEEAEASRRLAEAPASRQIGKKGLRNRRRLASSTHNAASEGGESEAVPKMEIIDFLGLFIAWAVVSIAAIVFNYLPKCVYTNCYEGYVSCTKPLRKAIKSTTGVEVDADLDGLNDNADNEAAMLRKLMKQVAEIQTSLAAVKTTVVPDADIKVTMTTEANGSKVIDM